MQCNSTLRANFFLNMHFCLSFLLCSACTFFKPQNWRWGVLDTWFWGLRFGVSSNALKKNSVIRVALRTLISPSVFDPQNSFFSTFKLVLRVQFLRALLVMLLGGVFRVSCIIFCIEDNHANHLLLKIIISHITLLYFHAMQHFYGSGIFPFDRNIFPMMEPFCGLRFFL
jgi:hypothetical protein